MPKSLKAEDAKTGGALEEGQEAVWQGENELILTEVWKVGCMGWTS